MNDAPYDLLVIGGGINGAGIAREAARRGLSVCLVDKGRFGWGTSGKSSMLAHGGLRYLEQFEFGLVHEALQDRERMLQEFPDLVKPLRFLYPIYPEVAAKRTVRVGLWLYDLLSHGKSVPKRDWLGRDDVLRLAPGLEPEGLRSGATYYDAQIEDVPALVERLIEQAQEAGATCLSHAKVTRLRFEDRDRPGKQRPRRTCVGADVEHNNTRRTIRARMTVNAAGPWVDDVLAKARPGKPQLIRRTKGAHLVVPRFVDIALIVKAASDGRTFFVLPWKQHCVIGTTDTDYDRDPGEAEATDADVEYLQSEARRYFPDAPVDKIRWTYAGVRPLVHEEGIKESHVTRRHKLFDHAHHDGIHNLWSLQGGKLTTFHSFGHMVVDELIKTGGPGRAA